MFCNVLTHTNISYVMQWKSQFLKNYLNSEHVSNKKFEKMNVSKTEALMIANMFATMSRADGVVQEIESFTTEALLEGFKTEDVQRMNDRYHFAAYHDIEQ